MNDKKEKLEQLVIKDTKNFPQNSPDQETCIILDDLFSKNELPSRQVQYCIINKYGDSLCSTNYLEEYNYNNRKFVRYQALKNQSFGIKSVNDDKLREDRNYWLEVSPVDKVIDFGIEVREVIEKNSLY